MRYVLECIWSGYTSSQSRCCHREILTSKRKVDMYRKINGVKFTDNTWMSVNVREAKHREHIEERNGYSTLFRNILRQDLTGFIKVEDVKGDF